MLRRKVLFMELTKEQYEWLGKTILDCAFEVHKELGPGLFESIYEECLCQELRDRGIHVENQVVLPVVYKGKKLNRAFRIDVLVENAILVEVKSVSGIAAIDETQLVSYLRLANMRLGYLINFNEILLKDGIRRKVNNFFYNKKEK